jgi:hypothetical protein
MARGIRQPEYLKLLKGTAQPCRRSAAAVPDLPGDPEMPRWLAEMPDAVGEAARKAWEAKTEAYAMRGQSVKGCEGALSIYCALEAGISAAYLAGENPSPGLVSQHRLYAMQFYDTSASRQVPEKKKGANRFAGHGRKASNA